MKAGQVGPCVTQRNKKKERKRKCLDVKIQKLKETNHKIMLG
jgi:hypothetical protein